jgi:hypothetical protein
MERKDKKYSIEEVLSKTIFTNEKVKVDFDGDLIAMNSDRYKTFKLKGTKCVDCDIEGQYFLKERHVSTDPYHFNLYAVNEHGHEILMTKDHIIPKADGGRDHIDNYRPMCVKCNERRGNNDKQTNIQLVIEELVKSKRIIFENVVVEKNGTKWIVTNGNGKLFTRNNEWVENKIKDARKEKDYEYMNTVRFPFTFAIKLAGKIK